MSNRNNLKIISAKEKSEGSGARVLRPFPGSQLDHVDPFVLMDEFFVKPEAGFPEHPHRGFEAVTYMLEGGFVHEDSGGNKATVRKGGLQRITMGKGIRHSETPAGDGMNHGIQLWINLPKRLKEMEPGYEVIPGKKLKTSTENGITETILIGKESGPEVQTQVRYRDIKLEDPNFTWRIEDGYAGFVYILSGNGVIKTGREDFDIDSGQAAVVMQNSEKKEYRIETDGRIRFVSALGTPHGEEVNMHGPYVD